MKQVLLLIFFAITISCFSAGPRLCFVYDSIKADSIPQAMRRAYFYFPYVNLGDSALRITKVKSECSCTTIFADTKSELAPGETGVIRVRYDAHLPGEFFQVVKIWSNSNHSMNPYLLTIEGNVFPNVDD